MRPVGRMRPANILARPALLNIFFPSNLCDAISKAEPDLIKRVSHSNYINAQNKSSVSGFSSSSIVMK